MTLSRIKPSGWNILEELSSSDLTAVDLNIENALDKRSGQSDFLASDIEVQGPLTFIETGEINT